MDKNQYNSINDILADDDLSDHYKTEQINTILGIDIDDRNAAKTFKEKVLNSSDVIVVEQRGDGDTTVEFDGYVTTADTFGLAFITTLLSVIAGRAIDKFLPEPQQPKEKSAGKRDGLGSPAPTRKLPIKGMNY